MTVNRKTVDATRQETSVPSTKKPDYLVSAGVNLVPINQLADVRSPWARYVVIGAGKTGLDALIFLLDREVDPDKISWIMSNDCWYLNREMLDPQLVYDNFVKMVNAQVQGYLV